MMKQAFASLSVASASIAALVVTILLPRFLSAADYVAFATYTALGQLIAVASFEWLKQSTLRFGGQHATAKQAEILGGYGIVAAVLVGIGGVVSIASWHLVAVGTVPLIIGFAIAQGGFDGIQAWFRAQLRNIDFGLIWGVRAILSLVVITATAFFTRNGLATLAAAAGVLLLSSLWGLKRARGLLRVAPRWGALRPYFVFGYLAAVGAALTAATQPLMRGLCALGLENTSAAAVILAIDVTFKLASIVGLSVNVVVSQFTYSKVDAATAAEKVVLERLQIAIPMLVLLPAALGFNILQPILAPWIVPSKLLAGYSDVVAIASIASALICARLFGLDPAYLMSRKAGLALVGPICTLLAMALWAAVLWALNLHVSARSLAFAYLLASVIGYSISAFVATRRAGVSMPTRQLSTMAVSAALMVLLPVLIPRLNFVGFDLLVGVICGVAYLAMFSLFESSAIRQWIRVAAPMWQRGVG